MSGLSRTPGKRVWVNPHRGFESRSLRHKRSSKKAPSGAFFIPGALSLVFSDMPVMIRRPRSHGVESNAIVETTRPPP